MRIWALIVNDIVENVCVWDSVTPWSPPSNMLVIEITNLDPTPGPGWTYQNGQFYPPTGE